MYKFLFNLQTQTLKIPSGPKSYSVLTEQFRTLGGIGFILDHPSDSGSPNSWIIFKVYSQKVKVIYKTDGVYYQRELFRPPGGVIEVEFSEWDRVKK